MYFLEFLTYFIWIAIALVAIWAISCFLISMGWYYIRERKSDRRRKANDDIPVVYTPEVDLHEITEEEHPIVSAREFSMKRRLLKSNRRLKIKNERLKKELKEALIDKNNLNAEFRNKKEEFLKIIEDLSQSNEKKERRLMNKIDRLNALINKNEFKDIFQSENDTHRKASFFAKLIEQVLSNKE